jgi:hypothetical protein
MSSAMSTWAIWPAFHVHQAPTGPFVDLDAGHPRIDHSWRRKAVAEYATHLVHRHGGRFELP